jgi:hypothetical protein
MRGNNDNNLKENLKEYGSKAYKHFLTAFYYGFLPLIIYKGIY